MSEIYILKRNQSGKFNKSGFVKKVISDKILIARMRVELAADLYMMNKKISALQRSNSRIRTAIWLIAMTILVISIANY